MIAEETRPYKEPENDLSQMRKRLRKRTNDQRSKAQERPPQHLLVDLCGLVVDPGQMAVLHRARPDLQDLRTQKAEDRQQHKNRVRVPELRVQLGEKVAGYVLRMLVRNSEKAYENYKKTILGG